MFFTLFIATNTMAQAVRERTSELAALKTVGPTSCDAFRRFAGSQPRVAVRLIRVRTVSRRLACAVSFPLPRSRLLAPDAIGDPPRGIEQALGTLR